MSTSGKKRASSGSKRTSQGRSKPGISGAKRPDVARARTGKGAKPAAAKSAKADAVRTVSFVSLGCPKNLVDSEKMLGLLAQDGLMPVSYDPSDPEGSTAADAVVINTCGFLEASKDESLQVIHDAIKQKEAGQVKRVVVAGCLVQRHRAKMLEWAPGIDAMIGVFDRDKVVEAVRGVKAARASLAEQSDKPTYWIAGNALKAAESRGMKVAGLTVNGKDGKGLGYFEDDSARLRLTPRHYAYLRVSEGCNQNCAFCTIPSIRGKMRSKDIARIKAEAKELLLDGAFELILIGQDTTSFGEDIGAGFDQGGVGGRAKGLFERGGLPSMLKAVSDAVEENGSGGWVRLMYAYPSNFRDEYIAAFAEVCKTGHVLPYIDIPLQHASNRMLSAMRRNVTREHQAGVLKKLRAAVPGMSIRTTFISGFPGETEADHRELVEFVREMKFDAVGVFEYSKEDGTVAGTMEGDAKLAVPAEVKARRRGEVMAVQQEIAFARAAERAAAFDEKNPTTTGERVDVLIDESARVEGLATSGVGAGGRLYVGRMRTQAPQIDAVTYVQSRDRLSPGEVVRCVIVGADGYDLVAKPVSELEKRVGLRVLK